METDTVDGGAYQQCTNNEHLAARGGARAHTPAHNCGNAAMPVAKAAHSHKGVRCQCGANPQSNHAYCSV